MPLYSNIPAYNSYNCDNREKFRAPSKEEREGEMNAVLDWVRQNTWSVSAGDVIGYSQPRQRSVGIMTDYVATNAIKTEDKPVRVPFQEDGLDSVGTQVTVLKKSINLSESLSHLDESAIKLTDTNDVEPISPTKDDSSCINVRSLYVKGRIEDCPVDLLLDTGADITLISLNFLKTAKGGEVESWRQKKVVIHTADGNPVTAWGPINTQIELCGQRIETPVYTAEIVDPVILGLPALKQLKAVVDLGNGLLKIGDCRIPCSEKVSVGVPRLKRVIVTRGCIIPPWSEKMVASRVIAHQGQCDRAIFVYDPGGQKNQEPLLVAKTLSHTDDKGKLWIRVANLSDKPRSIKRGKSIAQAEDTEEVEIFPIKESGIGSLPETRRADDLITSEIEVPNHLLELWQETCRTVDLNEEQKRQLANLFHRRQGAFAYDSSDIGRTHVILHDIDTEGATPVKQAPRRQPIAHKEEVEKQIEELKQKGLIEPSTSPWSSPVVIVKKKDGTSRFCIDYRELNSVTRKDAYPLPRTDETLDSLRGAAWFSTLDLLSGYWQVRMTERAKEASAFVVREGLFQWKVMPFGLCNAPATFERVMEAILRGLHWSICLIYLDDIIVYATDITEMLVRLDQILERIEFSGLKLKPSKCHLFCSSVIFLGHIVSREGIKVDPAKVAEVVKWPRPSNVKEIRAFLGFSSYYRRFVRKFASIASPLHALTKNNTTFIWSNECEEAFEKLKTCLSKAPVLKYPDDKNVFIIDTDASNDGLGAVLSMQDGNEEQPVAFASRTLSSPEKNYCATRKELLGVIYGLKQFRHYVLGRNFILRTDHGSLQ